MYGRPRVAGNPQECRLSAGSSFHQRTMAGDRFSRMHLQNICMNICVCNIANHDLKSSVYLSSQRLPLLKANMQRTPGASQDLLREQIYRLSAGSYFYRRSGQVNGTHTQHKHNLIFKNALPLRRLRFFRLPPTFEIVKISRIFALLFEISEEHSSHAIPPDSPKL